VLTHARQALETDDEHEPRVRLLLLRKGAVLAYCSTVRSLLGWTRSSSESRAFAPG
jgi:hypothetical protein